MAVSYVSSRFFATGANGLPAANALLYTYANKTVNPVTTYADAGGATPNANPIVLNARGEAFVHLPAGQVCTFTLKDSGGNLLFTEDDIGTDIASIQTNITNLQNNQNSGILAWSGATAYTAKQRVERNGVTYYAVQASTNQDPATDTNNTYWAIWALTGSQVQSQLATAFTTGGVAPAFTLTPNPPVAAYAAGQRFRVKFNAAGSASSTLAVSGLAAKNLMQYDQNGNKVAASITLNQLADVEYDGTDMVLLTALPPSSGGVQGIRKNLVVSTTGTNATVSATCDELSVENGSNSYATLRSVNLTINTAVTGANGIDVGSIAASTWYSVWAIYNGTTTSGLVSLSATAPTMPNGYTYKARIGWIRTDATVNKYPFSMKQNGARAEYVVAAGSNITTLPQFASGVSGTPGTTLTAVPTANFIPSTAAEVHTLLYVNGASTAQAGPNSVATIQGGSGIYMSGVASLVQQLFASWAVESSNIYYAGAGGGGSTNLYCLGWTDSI